MADVDWGAMSTEETIEQLKAGLGNITLGQLVAILGETLDAEDMITLIEELEAYEGEGDDSSEDATDE